MAAGYRDQHALRLRAGDVLHLAIAGDNGATARTFDHGMYGAGAAARVSVLVPAV